MLHSDSKAQPCDHESKQQIFYSVLCCQHILYIVCVRVCVCLHLIVYIRCPSVSVSGEEMEEINLKMKLKIISQLWCSEHV